VKHEYYASMSENLRKIKNARGASDMVAWSTERAPAH